MVAAGCLVTVNAQFSPMWESGKRSLVKCGLVRNTTSGHELCDHFKNKKISGFTLEEYERGYKNARIIYYAAFYKALLKQKSFIFGFEFSKRLILNASPQFSR